MSIDRNRILCVLALAAGILPFSGCGNSDKPSATPESVTSDNSDKPSSDHGGVLVLKDDGEDSKALAPNVYQFQLSEADKPPVAPFSQQYIEPAMDPQRIKSAPGTFGTLNGPGLENVNK